MSGRVLSDGLITRPEESCRMWCVVVCDQEYSKNEEVKARYWAVEDTNKMDCNVKKTNNNSSLMANKKTYMRLFTVVLFS
jgi:hypothetical protein